MTGSLSKAASTRVSKIIHAPRSAIYQAFLEPEAVAAWLQPESMTGVVHAFEPRPGGELRMSLFYQDPQHSPGGKTTEDTDTFRGRFVALVPDEKVVWLVEFDSPDPRFAGEMQITWSLSETTAGTEVTVLCENIPAGIRPEDNETGSRSSLQKLAAFIE